MTQFLEGPSPHFIKEGSNYVSYDLLIFDPGPLCTQKKTK